jgi:choline dehydrogenase
MTNVSNKEKRYDFIVVGAGAAGSVLPAELSASGAQVLVIESGGPDDAPTIMNPSIWFYNVGGPLDYHWPVAPSPRLNNRKFNMAGRVLGGGATITDRQTPDDHRHLHVTSYCMAMPRRQLIASD